MVQDALLTDAYQLSMLQGYYEEGLTDTAVFELFVRRLPQDRNFLVTAGLEQALDYLENLRFSAIDLTWLSQTGRYSPSFLRHLADFRFTGDINAPLEGTILFENEPLIQVIAPLPEAQFIETRLMNLIHFETVIASKAARCTLVARGKNLVDFGLRRAHGYEAGLLAARASYLAGFNATSTVAAGRDFKIPISGTMAHSFIQAHEREIVAFEKFAHANPRNITLLIDTYDTEEAARKIVRMLPHFMKSGLHINAVRIDSGDIRKHARRVRKIFDDGGFPQIRIFCSGGLDEHVIDQLLSDGAPIDGFGVGTSLTTAADAPYLDCAYKLQEYAGRPRRKRSEGKATLPGRKQVYRIISEGGRYLYDILTTQQDALAGTPLLMPIMRAGRRLQPSPPLELVRDKFFEELDRLPDNLRTLNKAITSYQVRISPALRRLTMRFDSDQRQIN